MNSKRDSHKTLGRILDAATQPLVAILISLLLGAVVILIIGKNPVAAYGEMIRGAFGKRVYLMNTLKRATPIIMGGLNARFALYGGISPRRMLYLVMILSGLMAGLGGAFEALGSKGRYVDQMIFSTGYAWSGMVAALLAGMNPVGTAVASILLAGLAVGGSTMMLNMSIPLEVCNIIEGIITLLMSVKLVRIAASNRKARKAAKGGEAA